MPDICIKDSQAGENVTEITLELYRLAGLVYLSRVSERFSGQSLDIELWTDKAFSFMAQLSAIDQPLPLFILGCEARSEDQRTIVLDLISRSEQVPFSRSLKEVTGIIQSVWVQDDLAEETLDYKDKLDAIFSSMDVVPSLA
jgi:Fungal specific transcription factor domain